MKEGSLLFIPGLEFVLFFFYLPVRLTSQLLVEAFDKPELVSKVTKQTSSLSLCQFWLQMYFKTP